MTGPEPVVDVGLRKLGKGHAGKVESRFQNVREWPGYDRHQAGRMDFSAQHEPLGRLVKIRRHGVQGVIAGGRGPHGFDRDDARKAALGNRAGVKDKRGRTVGAGNLQEDLSPAKIAIMLRARLDRGPHVEPLKFGFNGFDFLRGIRVVVLLAGEFQPFPRHFGRHARRHLPEFGPGCQLGQVRKAREAAAGELLRREGVGVGVHAHDGGGHTSRGDAGHEFRGLYREGVGLRGAGAFLGLVRCTTQTAGLLGRRGFILVSFQRWGHGRRSG